MDRKETDMLFNLLEQFYPNAKQLNETTKYAWSLALADYSYEDVRANALKFVTKNKYFPNICDLTAGVDVKKEQDISWMKEYMQDVKESPQ